MAGTTALIRLILRRDRVWLPLWLLMVAGFAYATVATIETLLPTLESRRQYAEQIAANPAVLLMQGPAYELGVGAIAAQQRAAATMIFAALGSVMFLVRHTRSDEQAGRRELLGAAPVGRHAPLTAALTVVLAADAVLAALMAALLTAAGMPAAGSLAWGLVAGCGGALATGMAAVAVQLTRGARPAAVGTLTLFFALYLARGVSELTGAAWLGWLVPTGWLLRARPYAGERWWVFAAAALVAAGLVVLAYRLAERRDLGAGLLPDRAGPATAAAWLRTSPALAWRMQRAGVAAWLAGAVLFGLVLGFGGQEAIERFGRSPGLAVWASRMGGAGASEVFYGLVIYVFGAYTVALCSLLTLSRLWREEADGSAEVLLAGPTGRLRWASGHVLIALAVPAPLLAVVGVLCGIGAGDVPGVLGMTMALLPAVWVLTALATAAYGLLGRAGAVAAWAAFALVVLLEFGWEIGVLGDGVFLLSPFAHVHYSALADPGPVTMAALSGVAAALLSVGLAALRRRDLIG
ncbi:hypothetical protein ABZW11_34560 [Nonomuraea sp. NPDC004580]|uniref:ABC transporter permease n=1 Tax=Nonomuraea sp. NPDC004580 TaxID=3154552 RepID=UPI0033A7874A